MKLVFREHNPQLYGTGALLFEWRPGGSNIAIAGSSGVVRLFNRYSEVTEEFNINEALPTVLCWAPKSSVLLIGDNKGNFILFNYRLSRKLPVMGKHQKAIKSASWNKEGTIFALASEDTSITLNNAEGETLNTFSWNGEISELQFTAFRSFASDREEDFISAIVARRNLIIVCLSDSGHPTNLQFQEGFGNGRLLVGFDQGVLVCLSAEGPAESIGQELFAIKEYNASFASISVNELLGKILKGRDLTELGEISDMINVDSDDSGLVEVACSEDGSMAAVSARSGALCVYLTKLPMLAAASSTHIAVLASLTEISIYQDGDVQPTQSLNIKVEPSLVAVGAKHIAIVLNNKAWFYDIKRNGTSFLYEHDYMTTILKLKLNREFVMARLDKRVHLHRIIRSQGNPPADSSDHSAGDDLLFPDLNETNPRDVILDADLSDKFFLYSTTSRFLNYYSLEHARFVSDFKHSSEIRTLCCEPDGIRTIFHDDAHDLYIYSPADDQLCKIPSQGPFMSSHQQYGGCLWESFTVDKDTFLVHDRHTIFVFMHVRNSRKGDRIGADQCERINGIAENSVNFISSVQIPFGNVPILLSKGIVHCHTQNGRVNTILLRSHKTETQFGGKSSQELNELLQQSLMLRRWRNASKICEDLKDQSAWRKFAETVMLDSNIELAVRIFRHLGDVAMVWSLEELLNIEDQQVLSGHVAALLGHFDEADSLFSNSSQPKLALEEAFDMAKSSGQVLAYANALEVNLSAERKGDAVLGHFGQLSEQFQAEGDVLNGGKFAGMAQQYKKALSLLLSEQRREEEALGLAVEYVAESDDKQLVGELVAHLMDEKGGGAPKDPKFLFQLYVKLKMYSEAAKTALIISHEQQQQGFYKTAHDLLFGMCQTLRRERIRTPLDMENSLMLLHSYNLVKLLLKKGDNYAGGRLLCRVVANIGQFPAHAVQILTSAVITCTKAGLKKSAFNFASQLMQPSFRQKIDDNYKKKIELVVRKFGQNAPDMEEHNAPCPFCDGSVREFALGCPNCQATIPFCIFTGRHIVKTDFAQCPHCRFPGSFSEFKKSADANCPMCYEKLNHQILPGSFDEFINEMNAGN
uniref:WD_REPEATS_REGION domain-containing protein n=1 Tax=Globodera pallida TaxID=36090 RepID=A0A183C7E0_GLOPA